MTSREQIFDDFAKAVFAKVLRRRKWRGRLLIGIHEGAAGGPATLAPTVLIDALTNRLRLGKTPLVPHAVVDERARVARQIATGLTAPRGWGTLRFPQYNVFRALESDACAGMDPQDCAFRKLHPFLCRFIQLPGAPDPVLWWIRLVGFVIVFAGWFEQLRFGGAWRRRMRRNWFAKFAGASHEDFFEQAATIMRGSDEQKKEGVLLRALLCDLDAAFTPRLSPWRRRRQSGFMVFIKNGDELADLVRQAIEDTKARHITVIFARSGQAAGAPNLAEATLRLILHGDTELQVTTRDIAAGATAEKLAGAYKIPVRLRSSALVVAVAVLQIVIPTVGGYFGAARLFQFWPWSRDETCLGETAGHAATAATPVGLLSSQEATRLYNADKQAIDAENTRVRGLASKNPDMRYTIKRIVYLGSGVAGAFDAGVAYNGVIPELHGIRLAQRKMNELAEGNPRTKDQLSGNVFVIVDIREAGKDYAQAPQIAQQVVRQSTETVLGVIGLGESRQQTLEALKTLGDGGLPILGMGATSEDMQAHPLYHQISFDNPYQARMFAAFARQANIIRAGESGRCVPADKALVIGDPTDNYSLRLGEDLVTEFPMDKAHVIWFPPPGSATSVHPMGTFVTSDSELLEKACAQLAQSADDRTVVFWSGRGERLRDFLVAAKDSAACPASFTVVSGGDISTTSVLKERFPTDFAGVTLFYSAHALPSSPPNSAGDDYTHRYLDLYKTTNDPWYDNWRGPIAYDGLVTMVSGINTVCRENGPAGCGRGSVASHFRYRIGGESGLRGATGIIRFVKDPWATAVPAPLQKRFLMLRATPTGPSIVMECGQRDTNDLRTTWGPKGAFDCPST
ncbi:hypothetical protein [Nonomuraea sp. NPDC049750]|uniref:hypothetical protein n=1 Tax=Nonomuraea sp. NPDC049750 TaxID=3154738 RepID=UPI0033F67EA1